MGSVPGLSFSAIALHFFFRAGFALFCCCAKAELTDAAIPTVMMSDSANITMRELRLIRMTHFPLLEVGGDRNDLALAIAASPDK